MLFRSDSAFGAVDAGHMMVGEREGVKEGAGGRKNTGLFMALVLVGPPRRVSLMQTRNCHL